MCSLLHVWTCKSVVRVSQDTSWKKLKPFRTQWQDCSVVTETWYGPCTRKLWGAPHKWVMLLNDPTRISLKEYGSLILSYMTHYIYIWQWYLADVVSELTLNTESCRTLRLILKNYHAELANNSQKKKTSMSIENY